MLNDGNFKQLRNQSVDIRGNLRRRIYDEDENQVDLNSTQHQNFDNRNASVDITHNQTTSKFLQAYDEQRQSQKRIRRFKSNLPNLE